MGNKKNGVKKENNLKINSGKYCSMSSIIDYISRKKRFVIITSIFIATNIWVWFYFEPSEPVKEEKQQKEIEYSDSINIA